MFRFFKENNKLITRLILLQFGGTVFGLVLISPVVQKEWLMPIMSVIATLFYLFLIYNSMWEEGAKERIRVDGGRAPFDIFRGLKAALFASVPNMIIGILYLAGHYLGLASGPALEWAGNMKLITYSVGMFWEGMYIGLIRYFAPINPFSFIAAVFPGLAVAFGAYAIGLHNRKIRNLFKK